MTASLDFSDRELRPADRYSIEVQAGHLVNALSKMNLRPDAANAMAAELDRLRQILNANRYERRPATREMSQ